MKYAALDCWQLVAQELPPVVTLQRSSFADGRKLTLSGQVDAADTQKMTDFYDALRKAKLKDQPVFDVSEQRHVPSARQHGGLELCPRIAALGGGGEMKKYLSQLRPLERRLVVGVAVVLLIVLNWAFIWPHFSDWSNYRAAGRTRRNGKLKTLPDSRGAKAGAGEAGENF